MDDIAETLRHPGALVGPLLLLLLAEQPSHGYALADRLRASGFDEVPTGSLYRELRRLEDAGWARSCWEVNQTRGPARRVYELTAAERRTLDGCAERATELSVIRLYATERG